MAGAGKGDKKRPLSKEFDENYDRLFGDYCRLNHAHDESCKLPPKEEEKKM